MTAEVVSELARLIAFPTVSSRPVLGIAGHLADRAEALGFVVERFDDPQNTDKTNVVATIGPPVPGGLVLSGHMDVVPVANQPWTTDPFVLTARDNRLLGRGTADMKGFIAATMIALTRIAKREYRRPLTLVWTHDEEVGCHGSAHLATTLVARGRRLAAACLVGEPTDFRILRMHAGHVAVRLIATGAAAHSAYPELGANAIDAAALAVVALASLAAELRDEHHPQADLERDFVPLNIGTVRGGSAINIVADRCEVELGYRPLPGQGHEPVLGRIQQRLAEQRWPKGTDVRMELIRVTPSLATPADTELQRLLQADASAPGTGAAGFATDGGNLARCGCAPLVFGPGSIQVAHQADEWIDGPALVRTVDIVERLVRARCCAE